MTMFRFPILLTACVLLMACARAPSDEAAAVPAEAAEAVAAEPVVAEVTEAPARNPEQPSLKVATIDGGSSDLAEQRGSWVVVNFWATWCGPCIKEIPDLTAFDAERSDVKVIGLAYEEISIEDLNAFLVKHPAGYPIAVLDVYDPPADFDTPRGLPMTYLIAPDGKVAKKFLGPVTSADLAAAITEASAPSA